MHFLFISAFIFIFLPNLQGNELGNETRLGTCCKKQKQFLNGTCATISERSERNEFFNEFVIIPDYLLPSKYRNSSFKFRYILQILILLYSKLILT